MSLASAHFVRPISLEFLVRQSVLESDGWPMGAWRLAVMTNLEIEGSLHVVTSVSLSVRDE